MARFGDCLYLAVLESLPSHFSSVMDLRLTVAADISNNSDLHEFLELQPGQTIDEYINNVKYGQEWAGQVEINALMLFLGQPIVVIGPDGNIRNQNDIDKVRMYDGNPIFVYYNGKDHYDAYVPDGKCDAKNILERLERCQTNDGPSDQLSQSCEPS